MKRFLIGIYFISTLLPEILVAQSGSKPLEINHLTGDYYIYTTYKLLDGKLFPANGMYILTSEGVVLIDSPWDPDQFQPLLDSIFSRHNKKVVACIVTHSHIDRTGGLDFLKEKNVKTYSSKLTYDLCKEKGEKQAEYYFIDDTIFTFGNKQIQTFYPGAGHTTDNIVLWIEDKKILYGGCFIKSTDSKDLGNITDANLKDWPASINRVKKKFPKPEYIIPGHFSWQSNKSLDHTLKLLSTRSSTLIH